MPGMYQLQVAIIFKGLRSGDELVKPPMRILVNNQIVATFNNRRTQQEIAAPSSTTGPPRELQAQLAESVSSKNTPRFISDGSCTSPNRNMDSLDFKNSSLTLTQQLFLSHQSELQVQICLSQKTQLYWNFSGFM